MRIDAFNQVSQIYKTSNKLKSQPVSGTRESDKVEISSFGKDILVAKQAVNNASDIREDKVAEIKTSINNGTYNISNDLFAEKLISSYENAVS